MGCTCFCSVQKRSVARTTVSAFVMKPKFRHKSRPTGLVPAANDAVQGINAISRHQLGKSGNKVPNSSVRKRGYRCLLFPSPSVPQAHMHFGPHQPVLLWQKTMLSDAAAKPQKCILLFWLCSGGRGKESSVQFSTVSPQRGAP